LVRGKAAIDTLRTSIYPWLRLDPDTEIPDPRPILLLILGLALLLRVLNAVGMSAIDLDGIIYARMGEAFSTGNFREGLRGVFPPVYPALIGLFHAVIPDLEFACRVVSLTAGLLLVYLSYFLFRRLVGNSKALYGAFFVAVNPYLVKCSASVLSESVATLLLFITIFAFYAGWADNDPKDIALSGFSLSLTYLTRPEYVVYVIPLLALLLVSKRFSHSALFLISFAVLAGAYIYLMRVETGMFLLSKKAVAAKSSLSLNRNVIHSYLLPTFPLFSIIKHIPTAFYDLLNALLPQFVLLAVLGIGKIERRYKVLMALAIIFHVLVVSAVGASSKRFYVELIPILTPFAAAGIFTARRYLGTFRSGSAIFYASMAVIVALFLVQGINLPLIGRGLNKQAGLYLLSHDPRRIIASRLPLISFYSRGEWQYIPHLARGADTCPALFAQMKKKGVAYVAVDEEVEKESPFVAQCLKTTGATKEFRAGEEFVRLYRLPGS
jgi:4-amino-4-deoxy-L-arabinose transferase-like glycosyltransferase